MMLETKRLVLRTLNPEDATSYFLLSQNKGFRRFQISDYQQSSIESARIWIENVTNYHRRNLFGIVGVFTKVDSKLIGLGALKYLEQKQHSPVELMYRISDEQWGNGYGNEIASALIEYAFNKIKLPTLVATVDPKNVPSKKILAKLGFRFVNKIHIQSIEEELYELSAPSKECQ